MMKKIISQKILELVVLMLLGLAPLLWFSNKQTILGHDAGLPIDPVGHFADRLFAWTERYAFGDDQTYALPGFFIHGLEALVSLAGFSLSWEQKITFIFWFLLPGITMYYFASKIEKKLSLKYFALPVAVFYMYNHFLLQGWFVAERTKFSLYAALPLYLLFLFDWQEKRRSTFTTAVFISLVFFFLNGMASLPLFGGVIICGLAFIIFYVIQFPQRSSIFRLAVLTLMTGGISLFLQAYWLLPYFDFITHSYNQSVRFFGGVGGILTWINYISEHSSFINLLRLQGIPEWYQNPLHPYADIFLHNPFLILISTLLPIAAFGSMLLYKTLAVKRILLFFVFLALFSMIFVAGSHPPFGAIYLLMVKFIPGFIAFRTPFYKFSPALWFAYALLIGFTINYFVMKYEKKFKFGAIILYCFIVGGIIFYSFPFLNGKFFDYMKGVRSMKTILPAYVLDFAKWIESPEEKNKRVLMLPEPNPDGKVEAYTWGYWSLAPLSTLYSNASIINDSFYFTENEKQLLKDLYHMMRQNNPSWKKLAEMFHINTIVLRNDFAWNLSGLATNNPSSYKEALSSLGVQHIKTFGKWDVYDLVRKTDNRVVANTKIQFFDGSGGDIGKLFTLPSFDTSVPIYASEDYADDPTELFSITSTYYIKPPCILCNLQLKYINPAEYAPVITRDSIFYRYLKNREPLTPIDGSPESLKTLVYDSYRSLLELSRLINERKSETIILESGKAYLESLQLVDDQLRLYNRKNKSVDEPLLFEIVSVLHNEQIELAGYISKISGRYNDYAVFSIIQRGLDQIRKIRRLIESTIDISLNENVKNFSVISRKAGRFTLYYNPNDDRVSAHTVEVTVNNEKLKGIHEANRRNGWYIIKDVYLHQGKNRLVISQPVQNIYADDQSHILTTESQGRCFVSRTITGNTGDIVKISFTHRRLEGSDNFFVKFSPSSQVNNFLDATDQLKSTSSPVVYENTYALGKEPSYNILICNRPAENPDDFSPSIIAINNLNIYKLAVPDVILETKLSKGEQISIQTSKINQTRYKVMLPKKSVLVLDQSFDKKWTISALSANHFVANGYANGWLVDSSGPIDMFYIPQRLVIIGFITSGFSAFVLLLYLLWRRIHHGLKK